MNIVEDDDAELSEEDFLSLEEPEVSNVYGRAAVILLTGKWDALTPRELIFNALSKVMKAQYNDNNVNIVSFNDETKLYVQESVGELHKFRNLSHPNMKFLSISGELVYKVAYVFYRRDGKEVTVEDKDHCKRAVMDRHRNFRDFVGIHDGYDRRFVNINISLNNKNEITTLLKIGRDAYFTGSDKLNAANHLTGHFYPHTFWTNDRTYSRYIMGPISTVKNWRKGHEEGIIKMMKTSCIAYTPRIKFIQRGVSTTYDVWITQQGYINFQKLINRIESFHKIIRDGKEVKIPAIIRPYVKRAAEEDAPGQSIRD